MLAGVDRGGRGAAMLYATKTRGLTSVLSLIFASLAGGRLEALGAAGLTRIVTSVAQPTVVRRMRWSVPMRGKTALCQETGRSSCRVTGCPKFFANLRPTGRTPRPDEQPHTCRRKSNRKATRASTAPSWGVLVAVRLGAVVTALSAACCSRIRP